MTRDLPEPNPITPKPCPCGGLAWLEKIARISGGYFVVRCQVCDRTGPCIANGPKAVEAWNEELNSTSPR